MLFSVVTSKPSLCRSSTQAVQQPQFASFITGIEH